MILNILKIITLFSSIFSNLLISFLINLRFLILVVTMVSLKCDYSSLLKVLKC